MRVFAPLALATFVCSSALQLSAAVPIQSSPVAISKDGSLLVNVNPDNNSVTVFSTTTKTIRKAGSIAVGQEPVSIALRADGKRAYVANSRDGTVTQINPKTRKAKTPFAVGAEPMGLILSPSGKRLYVANASSNNLMIFDVGVSPPGLIETIDLSSFGNSPRALAMTNNGDAEDSDETIFVAMFFGALRPGKTATDEGQDDQREGRVVAINAGTNAPVVNPLTALSPMVNTGFNSNGKLAPAPGQVPAVPSTNPQTFTTPTGAFPNQLAAIGLHPTNGKAYVVSTAASPNGPLRFSHMAQGLVSVFDVATRVETMAAQSDPIKRRTAPLNLNQGINLATTPTPRLFHTNPVALAWRPKGGTEGWAVIQNSNLLVRVDVDAAGIPSVGAPLVSGPGSIVRVDLENAGGTRIPGKAPRGLAISSSGKLAFVSNFLSRSVTMIKIADPDVPKIIATARSAKLPATGTPEAFVHSGGEFFLGGRGPEERLSAESWGGCVICHPNGRSDNITWMFDAGPRQTVPLDGTFNRTLQSDQRILNWSAVRDENQDFELNTRGVFGGRGLIDDDRLFFAIGGVTPAGESDTIDQFHQVTGAVTSTNGLSGSTLPDLPEGLRDFGVATLDDGRVYIIGGRNGAGSGTVVTGFDTVQEFNPYTNSLFSRSSTGFTSRHSLGVAAVKTASGSRIYAFGGYTSTTGNVLPTGAVEEYNPVTDTWRTVATLPTAVAQFGITVAGGVNTAEPLRLIHIVSGNADTDAAPALTAAVQRFQPDPTGPGTWTSATISGLTPRRRHGAATVFRGTQSRVFVIGGDASGTVTDSVQEYQAQALTLVASTHTPLLSPRERFGIASSQSTNQIYVFGGTDAVGAQSASIFEYTVANNGAVAGPAGTPSGLWNLRGELPAARSDFAVATPNGVTNFLPHANQGRSSEQEAMEAWIAKNVRAVRAPLTAAQTTSGRTLFGTTGLVVPAFSCATCHGGSRWTRSTVDYVTPPSPADNVGLGAENVIGAELRKTATQTSVLNNVGTFTLGGGRTNEVRFNGADISQAVNPLGANGFNIPSLLSVSETAPYYYSGLAQTLEEVLDGSQDGSGGTRHHFVTNPSDRAQLIQFLRSIDDATPIFP